MISGLPVGLMGSPYLPRPSCRKRRWKEQRQTGWDFVVLLRGERFKARVETRMALYSMVVTSAATIVETHAFIPGARGAENSHIQSPQLIFLEGFAQFGGMNMGGLFMPNSCNGRITHPIVANFGVIVRCVLRPWDRKPAK